jgi:hypothetical protein
MLHFAHRSSIILLIDTHFGPPLTTGWFMFLGLRILRLNRQKLNNPRHAFVDGLAQGTPMRSASGLNIF